MVWWIVIARLARTAEISSIVVAALIARTAEISFITVAALIAHTAEIRCIVVAAHVVRSAIILFNIAIALVRIAGSCSRNVNVNLACFVIRPLVSATDFAGFADL